MSLLSRLTYSLEIKLNVFLQAFKIELRIEDLELQVDALLEMSFAKMKTRNRATTAHSIDTQKFMGQLGMPFRGHWDSGRLEPVSDIKGIDTSTGNFQTVLQLHYRMWETLNLPRTSKNLLLMQHI